MLSEYRLNSNKENIKQLLRDYGFKKDSYTKALIYRKRVTDPNDILFIVAEVVIETNSDLVKLNYYDSKHNRFNPSNESPEVQKGLSILEDMKEKELLIEPELTQNKEEKEVLDRLKEQREEMENGQVSPNSEN
ncbi:hypothetical protein UFVDC4_00036 [Staphylococcus phage vB_SauM-UFV_DC4]|nr:hypothetical protein UFVDC4_00036 [Staphylococcus phage vB_SauM-UFV_DC4]